MVFHKKEGKTQQKSISKQKGNNKLVCSLFSADLRSKHISHFMKISFLVFGNRYSSGYKMTKCGKDSSITSENHFGVKM